MHKNSIILNGKRYDASTGALLGTVADSQFRPIKHTKLKPVAKTITPAPQTVIKPTAPKPVTHIARKTTDRSHHIPKTAARKTVGPKTLMRTVVKKPQHSPHPVVKKHYPAVATSSVLAPKVSVNSIDPKRLHRAKKIGKSARVGKFQDHVSSRITPKFAPITVAPAPATHNQIPQVSAKKPVHHSTSKQALFEHALANAKSHEQPAPVKHRKTHSKHRRLLHSVASLTAVLVIGASIMYLNKGSVELQLASVRAGFQASMPNYAPAGFERAGTETSDGKVAIKFTSPLDKQNFTISQQASSWDSQTLFDSVVASNTNSYQTVLSGGRTIFLYGNDQAAWVDGGILYKLQGNADLTKDQISSIASSM